MQTNREDCGDRHKEVVVPRPPNRQWAQERSKAFRTYFTTVAKAKEAFLKAIGTDTLQYIASVAALTPTGGESEEDGG